MADEKDLNADDVREEVRSAVDRLRKQFTEIVEADSAPGEVENQGEKTEGESP